MGGWRVRVDRGAGVPVRERARGSQRVRAEVPDEGKGAAPGASVRARTARRGGQGRAGCETAGRGSGRAATSASATRRGAVPSGRGSRGSGETAGAFVGRVRVGRVAASEPSPRRALGCAQSDAGKSASVESSRRRRVAARRRAPRARPRNPARARFRGTTGGTRKWDGRRAVPRSRSRRENPRRRKRRENPMTKTPRNTRRGIGEPPRIGTGGSPGLPRTRRRRRRETRARVSNFRLRWQPCQPLETRSASHLHVCLKHYRARI